MIHTYIIKVLICSGVLYTYFALALRNSTLHRWNRVFLLLAPLVSLLLPLVQFPVEEIAVMQVLQLKVFTLGSQPATTGRFDYTSLLYSLYCLIACTFIVRILLNWRRLQQMSVQGDAQQQDGYTLIRHEDAPAPFSFFNRIFFNDAMESPVLRHELAHVQGLHSADKMLMEVLCAVCWFNPFFYLMKRDLAMVHEYIADQEAAADTPADYAKVLLQMTLQTQYLPGVSRFTQSPVKRRISMLFTHKTNNTIMKKTIILPVATALLIIMGCQHAEVDKPAAKPTIVEDNVVAVADAKEEVFTFVDNPPKFPGGETELGNYLMKNIKYPRAAQEAGASGTVFVQFTVGSDGQISNVKTVGEVKGNGLEEESIRVVATMPKWVPGEMKGKKVAVQFNLPIRYTLQS